MVILKVLCRHTNSFHVVVFAQVNVCTINAVNRSRAIIVRASKPISKHFSVSDVRPSEPISSIHGFSSNIVSASSICASKTVTASNVCSG